MGIKSSADIMRILKKEWDKSEKKEGWKMLTGRNPKGRYDLFISSPERVWQIKTELMGSNEIMGLGIEVGKMEEGIKELMKRGSPVPFGMISPQKRNLAIILAGIQQYSSDSAYKLCREYVSDKQSKLDEKLDREIEKMRSNPIFRRKYEEQKEREWTLYG